MSARGSTSQSSFSDTWFSTAAFPERERVAATREVLGPKILRVELEPAADGRFRLDIGVRMLPGLGMASAAVTGLRVRRTRDQVAQDGDDDLYLNVILSGESLVKGRGSEVLLREGDAVLTCASDPTELVHTNGNRFIGLKIPRAMLAPLVPNIDDTVMRFLPRGAGALSLLTSYVGILAGAGALPSADVELLAVNHVYDLIALTLGASKDAAAVAVRRGMPAARLRAIKSDIVRHLTDCTLGIASLTARHGISESYIRKLFMSEGTTFSTFLLDQRLVRAHRLLTDDRLVGRTISSIAFEVGFGDLSYFNRCFLRRFGATPSGVRAAARRNGDQAGADTLLE